jgi:hypothetical protein
MLDIGLRKYKNLFSIGRLEKVLNQGKKMLTKTPITVGRESWRSRLEYIRIDQKFFAGLKTKRHRWHTRIGRVEKYGTAMSKRYLYQKRLAVIKTFHRQAWINKNKQEES